MSTQSGFRGFLGQNDVMAMLVRQLKLELRSRNMNDKGNKAELQSRLLQCIHPIQIGEPSGASTVVNISEVGEPEHVHASSPDSDMIGLRIEMRRLESENAQLRERLINLESIASTGAHSERNRKAFQNPRDVIDVLPIFDPSEQTDGLSADQFINRLTTLKNLYEWNDKLCLFSAAAKLRGAAKLWFDCQDGRMLSWDIFCEELVKTFPVHLNEADIHFRLTQRFRQPEEDLDTYVFFVSTLASKIKLSDTAICQYIIAGLRDNALSASLASVTFTSVQELLLRLKNYELYKHKQNVMDYRPISFKRTYDTAFNRPRDPSTFTATSDTIEKRTCYNCYQTGHLSANCPKPARRQRCSSCHKTGQHDSNCPHKIVTHQVKLINIEKSVYYKCVWILRNKFNAFIDLGSDCSLIRANEFASLNIITTHSNRNILKGFGGGVQESIVSAEVEISINRVYATVNIIVVRDDQLDTPVLIGRDFLDQPHVRIIKEFGKLIIENNDKFEFNADLKPISTEGINCDANLTEDEKNQLSTLINQHRKCFAVSLAELGKHVTSEMKINLSSDEVFNLRSYRMAFTEQIRLQAHVEELRKNGIIQPSTSEYSSPAMLIAKSNGEDRLCIDYRKLNSITRNQPFPMPIIEEQLSKLSGMKFFSTLDLISGYYQIPIEPDSRKYTAFSSYDNRFEFTRMSFGLKNAPAVFQNVINEIINKMETTEVLAYLDDIIVPSATMRKLSF